MGSQSTMGSDWVRLRLEYLARETAEEAPEISLLLLALSIEPTEANNHRRSSGVQSPRATPQVQQDDHEAENEAELICRPIR